MKIKVLTMHAAHNYGAVLQTYATQYVFEEKFDAECEIVNYVSTQRKLSRYLTKVIGKYKKSKLLSFLFIIRVLPERLLNHAVFSRFLKKNINVGKEQFETVDQLKKASIQADVFCVGSDQVWNPIHNDGIDEGFFLGFTDEEQIRISYASSMAIKELDTEYKDIVYKLLSRFKCISFREESTKSVLEDLQLTGTHVLDPTLLLGPKEWKSLIEKDIKIKTPYLLLYWFGNTDKVIQQAKELAKANNLRIVRISVGFEHYKGDDIVMRFISPEMFLGLFERASIVVTNSFHGTAFSINFKKQFYTFLSPDNMDERFSSILSMFDLTNRNMYECDNIRNIPLIDYDEVHSKLNQMRKVSLDYLKRALS